MEPETTEEGYVIVLLSNKENLSTEESDSEAEKTRDPEHGDDDDKDEDHVNGNTEKVDLKTYIQPPVDTKDADKQHEGGDTQP